MTPAQADRLVRIQQECRAGGTRLTVRELRSGLVRLTERERGEKPQVWTMGLDGQYL